MADRSSRRVWLVLAAMAAVSLAVRLNNVATFPGMRGPDGFAHFTYIWHLASTGTIPLATSGWSFFHPPLYYAWMAAVWNSLSSLDADARLKIGTGVIAALGLVHAFVAFAFVRRRHPGRPVLAVAAAAYLLFLPLQLFSAGYLGNESLHAVLASLSLLAAIRLIELPSPARAGVLGLLLGAAMLTKFSAIAIVSGTLFAFLLVSLQRRELGRGVALTLLTGGVATAVCGWFYVRNVEVYGDPFRMSRDTLAVSLHENMQMQGARSLEEFLLFDPLIVARPQWPRGMPLVSDEPREFEHSALRESVWTGMFANTYFDAQGNQVLPPVTHDEASRRAGQILLLLGLLPTALVVAGLASTILGVLRRERDEADILMLACFGTSIALFVVGAKSVPMHAAIKATYLMHASAMFAYWFAAGLALLDGRLRRLTPLVLGECAALALVSVVVFSQGVFLWRDYVAANERVPIWNNLQGIVAYAGGDRDEARRRFEYAASANLYLAEENLAVLALEEGRTLESLYRMRLARRLQPSQSIGWRQDRVRFDRETQAEYGNSIGAAYYELGRSDDAASELAQSMELDGTIPETSYDMGIVDLERALAAGDDVARRRLELSAARSFATAYRLDPGFVEAGALAAEFDGEKGTCRDFDGVPQTRGWTPRRAYPLETTTGNMHASGLQRRRHITRLSDRLQAELEKRGCPI